MHENSERKNFAPFRVIFYVLSGVDKSARTGKKQGERETGSLLSIADKKQKVGLGRTGVCAQSGELHSLRVIYERRYIFALSLSAGGNKYATSPDTSLCKASI